MSLPQRPSIGHPDLLQHIIEGASDPIFVKDTEGRYLHMNSAEASAFESPLEELLGQTDKELYPDQHEEIQTIEGHVLETGETRVDETDFRPDSPDQKTYSTCRFPWRNRAGRIAGVIGIARDVTEGRRREKTLRVLMEGTASVTGDDFFRSLARHLTEALGARHTLLSEFVDEKSARVLAFWPAELHQEGSIYSLVGTPCEKVVRGEVRCYPELAQEQFPDVQLLKQLKAESYFGAPLKDSAGKTLGHICMFHEKSLHLDSESLSIISIFADRAGAELERRRSERARKDLETQLQHARKLESLGALTGGIAHDFNNILTGILGNADLARMSQKDPAVIQQCIDTITMASLRASELCQQLLTYAGKAKGLPKKRVQLSKLAQEMVQMFRVTVPKTIDLSVDLRKDLPVILIDDSQIGQLIMNLVLNAAESIRGPSGTVSVSTGTHYCTQTDLQRLQVNHGLKEGVCVYFRVADTGRGMDESTASRIFDPFFSTKFTGRGLGLATTLATVRDHSGGIEVQTQPEKGTVFTILFPIEQAPNPTLAEAPAPPGQLGSIGTVLVVDDERVVRDMAKSILEMREFRVLVAPDGPTAIEVFRQHQDKISIVLLDLMMPGMDGLEVFEKLRILDPNVQVLLSTGYRDQSLADQSQEKGFAGILEKPYRPVDLVNRLRLLLQEKAVEPKL